MKIRLLVLANSYKLRHRCIAGIELESGKWLRPLSPTTDKGQIPLTESSMPGGGQPRPLDVVEIEVSPIKAEYADFYSPEDCCLERSTWSFVYRWENTSLLRQFVSQGDYLLHSRVKFVRQGYLMQLPFEERRTLELREVTQFQVLHERDESGLTRYLSKIHYLGIDQAVNLKITDVQLRDQMNQGLTGSLGTGFVCLSLALPLEDQEGNSDASKRYKLVASWIPLNE